MHRIHAEQGRKAAVRNRSDLGVRIGAFLFLVLGSTGCLNINAYVSEEFVTYVEQVPLEAVRGMEYNVSTGSPPPPEALTGLTDYREAKAPLLDRPAMQSVKNITYAFEHVVLANAAIADLYRQLGSR